MLKQNLKKKEELISQIKELKEPNIQPEEISTDHCYQDRLDRQNTVTTKPSTHKLDEKKNIAKFVEKFKDDDTGKTRKQEHILYMDTQEEILRQAQDAGFIIQGKIDLLHCSYENQYLYILVKPQ